MNSRLCQEAIEFFRSAPVYERLLVALRKRYQVLGRIGGTVTLSDLSPADREALGQLFGKDFSHGEQIRVSFAAFAKTMQQTRFAEITVEELLEEYFQERLVTRAEREEEEQQEWEELFINLKSEHEDEYSQQWLDELVNRRGSGYRLVLKMFTADRGKLRGELGIVCQALSRLPVKVGEVMRLPMFATDLTKDPHALDLWTDLGKLFQAALATVFGESLPKSGEDMAVLYRRAGILKGDISSYVTTYGLVGYKGVETHPLWRGAFESREVLQVTLDNLYRVDRVVSPSGRVYVVENPAVFSELVEACGEMDCSFICSNGQLRLATWVVLDMLVSEGVEVYYSGDFDPEGLGIAQRLVERYPDNVVLWRYDVGDYRKAMSEVELGERRLSQLVGISAEVLAGVKEEMLRVKKAGYQEQLVEEMIGDVRVGWRFN